MPSQHSPLAKPRRILLALTIGVLSLLFPLLLLSGAAVTIYSFVERRASPSSFWEKEVVRLEAKLNTERENLTKCFASVKEHESTMHRELAELEKKRKSSPEARALWETGKKAIESHCLVIFLQLAKVNDELKTAKENFSKAQ